MPWFCATCGRWEDACPNGKKNLDITRTLRSVGPEGLAPGQSLCVAACPTGLAVAFYLRKKGHHIIIFEARTKAGGMMRYGILCYRLPSEILDKEKELILS